MLDTHLNAPIVAKPADLQHLDATLANLRRAERDVAAVTAALAEARAALADSPGDPEAARRVAMAELRMRAEAAGLAHQFANLTRERTQ